MIYSHVSGFNGVSPNATPIQLDQTFFLASCTKLITSIAALQTVERGLIGLDEPLDSYLPELVTQPIIEPTTNSGFILRPASQAITLRHLLIHSSGIVYDVIDPTLALWRASRGETPRFPTTGIVTKDYSLPRVFEAGESWMYGPGLDWASLLVTRLNNSSSFPEYITRNIAEPLGIKSFTWHLSRKPEVEERLMRMSTRRENGVLVDGVDADLAFPEPDERGGSGGLGMYASVPDFVRVLGDLLKENPVLLKEETVDMLFTPQFAKGSNALKALEANGGMYRQVIGGQLKSVVRNHSLGGLLVMEDIQREDYYKPKGTLTWDGKPNLMWSLNRERGLGLMFATQVLPSDDARTQELIRAFERAVWKHQGSAIG
jgi:CubicO group peptidase (beta-lactamase class C family)